MGKKIQIMCVLLAGLYATQSATGTYTGSTHYEHVGDDGRVLSGRIDFAVFDTTVDTFGYTAPGDGRYIYAYQIINDEGSLQEAVGYFSILLGGAAYDGIGSDVHSDDTEAVEPISMDEIEGNIVFGFQNILQDGLLLGDEILEPGMHSYILIYTSDNNWVAGDYKISGGGLGDYETELPITTPEPATIFLLGMGAGTILMKKKFFRRISV